MTSKPHGAPPAATKQPVEDKRRETHYPATQNSELTASRHGHGTLFSAFRFADILSALFHTRDFKDSRAGYIASRLRFMAFFFAVAVPLYIPVDYFTLKAEHFMPIVIARCILSLVHIAIGLTTLLNLTIRQVNILVAMEILAASLFYVVTMDILLGGSNGIPPIGYSFMPFLIIAMLGVFPLTLVSSLLIMMLVVGSYAGLQIWLGVLFSRETLDALYLFLLFMGIILWLQSGQLLMLLKLYRESTRDPLTGLINRRVLMKFLEGEVDHNLKSGRHFSVLMLDLDRFKRINDDYGHLTGDMVLMATARMLELELRLGDIVARFGGEEFVVVLPGVTEDVAAAVAERICKACTGVRVLGKDGREVTFTCSIGVTEYISGEAIEITLGRVDDALYDAKNLGRNRVTKSRVTSGSEH